jgi:hypothetical protein
MVLHAHISPGGWTIGPLVAAVQRHSLSPSLPKYTLYRQQRWKKTSAAYSESHLILQSCACFSTVKVTTNTTVDHIILLLNSFKIDNGHVRIMYGLIHLLDLQRYIWPQAIVLLYISVVNRPTNRSNFHSDYPVGFTLQSSLALFYLTGFCGHLLRASSNCFKPIHIPQQTPTSHTHTQI